jgi:hypothetical protein
VGTTITNQNLIQKEIKRKLNSGSACYNSVQNLLSAVKKHKNQDIQNYNVACGFVWLRNLTSDIKGGTQTEGV